MQSALFIGRFQPFHNGHLFVIKEILKKNDRVIIGIGSAEDNYTETNPMTAGERFALIDAALKEAKIPEKKYCIIPIRNINNYAIWVNHVNTLVPPYTRIYTGSKLVKACYEGKHDTEIIDIKREFNLNATLIREKILKNKNWESLVPKSVAKLLKLWDIPKRLKTIH